MRAKDYEIDELRLQLSDREAISADKIADARSKLTKVEKSIMQKVEGEYADILEKKENQLKFHDEARQEA